MSRRLIVLILLGTAGGGAWWFLSGGPRGTVANSPPREGPIVAFGDSLTFGIGAAPGQTYPEQLGRLIDKPIVNMGVPGETAEDALGRIDEVIAMKPGIVLVCLGGNNLLQNKPLDETFRVLDIMVKRLIDEGAMVALIGIEGLPMVTPDYSGRFDALAAKHQVLYVPDFLDGIYGRGRLMADPIHPNGEGYAIISKRIAKAMKPYL